jgi:hypothetical protein
MKYSYLAALISGLILQGCEQSTPSNNVVEIKPAAIKNVIVAAKKGVTKKHPQQVYFGDTHLHTDLSLDAGAFGNRIGLNEAYRFAKGEEVISSTGQKAKLSRPLDFIVVADHSDGMGLFPDIINKTGPIMDTPEGKRWSKWIEEGKSTETAIDIITNFSQRTLSFSTADPAMMKPVWKSTVDAAEKYNEPGKFTAFIGYEWTSLINGNNLHRVVIYRDDSDKTIDTLPFTNEQSSDPEMLWQQMSAYEKSTGGQVLAIPHNGNLSNGMMFMESTVDGKPFTSEYVQKRAKWEPLYEVTQIKGDGESHPFLSPDDEFADYENWDKTNLDYSQVKTQDMLEFEYARSALKSGLRLKDQLGTNPYKFGMIGSTDSHTSLSTADDNNFFGKASNAEPNAKRAMHPFMKSKKGVIYTHETLASGYAGVWATENTRKALWDAMARKETYATTGSRMTVRFFGGWHYNDQDIAANLADNGYSKGVPMGGTLESKDGNDTPSFIVAAMQDPEGGSLDRVQVVKGWLNKDGSLSEKVYDVVWAGDRKINAQGKLPSVGNTVNLTDASWDNSIGAAELTTLWKDPDFNAELEAFYYVRVIEIPTPRWTLYDKLRFDAKFDESVKLINTERAYTSPIWYSPK